MKKKISFSLRTFSIFLSFLILIYFLIPTFNLKCETYWNPLEGLFLGDIRVIKVGNDNTVYTGTSNAGLYISKNAGNSWKQVYETLIGQKLINSIAIIDNSIIISTGASGIFRSTNNGISWDYIPPFDINISFYTFASDNQKNLFAGTSNGVYLSTDRGLNWIQKSKGLPIASVFSLFKSSKGILYAGLFPAKGVFKSTDNGENWFPASENIPNANVYEFAEHPDGTLYIGTNEGIYKSTNQGNSWHKINTGFKGSAVLTIQTNGVIYAGTSDDGIYISSDGGTTWFRSQIDEEKKGISVYSIAIAPNDVIYAGTSEGIYKSLNNGISWEPSNKMLNAFNVRALFSKRNAEILTSIENYGIFKTTDNGVTWRKVNTGLATRSIYTFISDRENNIIIGTGLGVYRSIDDGESWVQINDGLKLGPVYSLAKAANGDLYAAVRSWGIYKSTNNGTSWFESSSGIPDAALSINTLLQASDGTIYAGSNNGGLFKSTNNGLNWRKVQEVNSNVITCILETKSGTLIVASKSEGLWRSSDGGDSWINIKSMFGNKTPVIKTIINAIDDELLIGTYSSGIFRSLDDGISWEPYNDGLFNLDVEALLLTENNSIFIGTLGSGLWGHIIPVSVKSYPHFEFDININPIPVYNEANVIIRSMKEGNLVINIYDMSGRSYGNLYKGFINYGENIIRINLSALPKGVYFLDFNFLGYNFVQKVIKTN